MYQLTEQLEVWGAPGMVNSTSLQHWGAASFHPSASLFLACWAILRPTPCALARHLHSYRCRRQADPLKVEDHLLLCVSCHHFARSPHPQRMCPHDSLVRPTDMSTLNGPLAREMRWSGMVDYRDLSLSLGGDTFLDHMAVWEMVDPDTADCQRGRTANHSENCLLCLYHPSFLPSLMCLPKHTTDHQFRFSSRHYAISKRRSFRRHGSCPQKGGRIKWWFIAQAFWLLIQAQLITLAQPWASYFASLYLIASSMKQWW